MLEPTPSDLSSQVQSLLDYCAQLERQNRQLRERQQSLLQERNRLRIVRDETQKQVEAMIDRLRAMER
ncbi:DUF904 domain-containing protein [Motiliproteus coralliicola]|uniref:DUF904 domain-containing protein n=1 Tax=Motiliproteus coralliicola TaxID=2283196 RepID=A0A369WA54_9GAMM|nr:DUF904 domain-containing protein [Motiliproteus coralliicola]RDE18183.1 DUF904 domain-containing protein [Motiliproteus coralliicola]